MPLKRITEDPFNGEAPLRALGEPVTPIAEFYVRNNFPAPALEASAWRLRVHGRVDRERVLDFADLLAMPRVTRRVTFECAGNGRRLISPPTGGTQWGLGAAGTALFTGTPLWEVLREADVARGAVECVFTGADGGVVPERGTIRFQRSLPLIEAMADGPMLAWEMNGQPLTADHGFPLRLVVPDYYAVASVKWLVGIEVIDHPFDGYFQTDRYVYRDDRGEDEPVTRMRVRALILSPEEGAAPAEGAVTVAGVAWSGYGAIERVQVSVDGGRHWIAAETEPSRATGVAVRWEARLELPPGDHRILARATDSTGDVQPLEPVRNDLGYGNNVVHAVRIDVRSAAREVPANVSIASRVEPSQSG